VKLSDVSKILITTIVSFIISAVVISIWGWNELDNPYKISQTFEKYKSAFDTDAPILLKRYLVTGHADSYSKQKRYLIAYGNRYYLVK
jgi:hypothetical protein